MAGNENSLTVSERNWPWEKYNDHDYLASLHPPDSEQMRVSRVVERLFSNLSRNLKHLNIHNVMQGGSTAKRTRLREHVEVDILVVFSKFDLEKHEEYLKAIYECLKDLPGAENGDWIRSHTFHIDMKLDGVLIDILAGEELPRSGPKAFLGLTPEKGRAYDGSCCRLRTEFIASRANRDTILRPAILTVKDWVRFQESLQEAGRFAFRKPSSWLLELLVVRAQESLKLPARNSSPSDCFLIVKHAFELIPRVARREEAVYWTEASGGYYSESDAGSALQKAKEDSQPSVLDPVNPTNNVAATLPPGGWQELAARAEACTAWFKSPEGLQFLPASHATRQRLVSDGKQADGKLPDGNVRKKQLLHELCQKEGWVVRYDNRRLDLDPSQTSFVSTVEVGAKDVVEGEVSQKAHLCCEGEAAPSKQKAEASAAACVLARIKSDDEFALPKQPSTHAPGCCSHCSRGSKGAASNIESVGTSGAVAAASFASAALGADADADGHCGERHCDRELFFSALWKFLAGILVFSLMSGWLFACGLFRRDVR